MLFLVSLLTSTKKTKSKPGETTTEIYNKPRLTWITKFTTTQNSHASGTQKYYLTQNKLKQLKPKFGNLLRPLACKWSKPILKDKVSKEVRK